MGPHFMLLMLIYGFYSNVTYISCVTCCGNKIVLNCFKSTPFWSFSTHPLFPHSPSCVSRKVFLKHRINRNTVCGAIRDLPWHKIWLADNPVEVLCKHLSLLVGHYMYQQSSPLCVTWISLGLMIAAGMLLDSGRRLIFSGRDHSRVSREEFVYCQVIANETYYEAKHQFSDRNRDILMNVHFPHKWWSTLKSMVFGSSSSLPLLVSEGSERVCESVGNAHLLSDHFDSKQSREAVDLLLTCHPSPSLTKFVFRSSEVRRLLLDFYPYGGTDPLGRFPLFHKRTIDVIAPCLSVVFRWLVRLGSFPAC